MLMLLLLALLVVLPVALGYRYWPDICRSIVNTGLESSKPKEPTPVERFQEVVNGPPPIRADPAIANLASILNRPPAPTSTK